MSHDIRQIILRSAFGQSLSSMHFEVGHAVQCSTSVVSGGLQRNFPPSIDPQSVTVRHGAPMPPSYGKGTSASAFRVPA
jgi:hypothetical protein